MKRRLLLHGGTLALLLTRAQIAHGAAIVAVRVWPAPDYSRVTIESDTPLRATSTFVPSPPRLAVDIDGLQLNDTLRELVGKVRPDDPNIERIRVGQYAPGVVRLVIDLKQPVTPQVFSLAPVAAYQHRLVFDLVPQRQSDPLAELIASRLGGGAAPAPSAAPSPPAPSPTASATPPVATGPAVAPPTASLPVPRGAGASDPLGELIARRAQGASAPGAPTPVPSPAPSPAPAPAPASPVPPSNAPVSVASQPENTRVNGRSGSANVEKPVDRVIIVALDPGHGGEDPGAIGPAGTKEKDVVLSVARRLRERLDGQLLALPDAQALIRVYMTRDADFFVPLHVRVQKARRVQADLLVSIHADAFFTPRPQGASVFALSDRGASSAAARWLADKENAADAVGGVNVRARDAEVRQVLAEMSTSAQIRDSLVLGEHLLGEIGRVGRLHKPRVEQAAFAVLKAPDIPSVLVETAFISNPEEEERLRSEAYQEQLAEALARGVLRHFRRHPPALRRRA